MSEKEWLKTEGRTSGIIVRLSSTEDQRNWDQSIGRRIGLGLEINRRYFLYYNIEIGYVLKCL